MKSFLVCVLIATVLGPAAMADLVGWWKLDETSGTDAADSSGFGNNGRLVAEPGRSNTDTVATWTVGSIGGAMEFSGTRDFINLGTDSSLDVTDGFTFAAWVQIAEGQTGEYLGIGGRLWRDAAPPFNYLGFSLVRHEDNVFRLWIGNEGTSLGTGVDSNVNYIDTDWHHVAGVRRNGIAYLYVDGIQQNGSSTRDFVPSKDYAHIGKQYSSSHNRRFAGLIDEVYYFNNGLSTNEIQEVMAGYSTATVFSASPADGATDVGRDVVPNWVPGQYAETHDIYFGTDLADVIAASRSDPRGVLGSQGQATNAFDPGRLALSQTYYWRVDEVNGTPDNTVFKGNVWSFTTEPFSRPMTGITATASSSFNDSSAQSTLNGSGLADDLHGVVASDMWISGGIPATIDYAFDRTYKLHELWIWNSNQAIEALVGFGAKDVVIEHSLDGQTWSVLEGVSQLAQGPGTEGYAHNTTIDFSGIMAQYVRISINSVHGFAQQASLSEVRFFYMPRTATQPSPDSGATNVAHDAALSWAYDGREAMSHNVLLGTEADSLTPAGSVSESTLAVDLQLSQTYYWRVDEVNEAMDPSTWTGDVWS